MSETSIQSVDEKTPETGTRQLATLSRDSIPDYSSRSGEKPDPNDIVDRLSDDVDDLELGGIRNHRTTSNGSARTHNTLRSHNTNVTLHTVQSVKKAFSFFRWLIYPPTPPTLAEAGPPPDGGWQAWTTCICTHLVFANTWGFVNSFGIFQTYYADFLAPLPPSTISWIGSVQVFLSFFLSGIAGWLNDSGHFHKCYWFGTVCMLAGIFGTSFCRAYWQFMLAQGFAVGLGAGFLCCPSMSTVTQYFQRRRLLALGVLTCGNVTGGLVYPAMARQLLPSIGFAWTLRAIGFMQLAMLGVAGVLIRPRVRVKPGTASGPIFDFKAMLEPEYAFYAMGMVFNIGGTFIVYYYVSYFARTAISPPMSYPQSLNMLLIFNGVGTVGRLSAAYLADHVGPLNMVYPMAFLSALFCFAWIAVHDQAGLYGWISSYALVAGSLQALFPAGLTSLSPDMSKIGQRIGMGFSVIGFAVVAGPPAAGAMVTRLGGKYTGTQAYAGSMLVVGGCFVVAAKIARVRRTGCSWWAKI